MNEKQVGYFIQKWKLVYEIFGFLLKIENTLNSLGIVELTLPLQGGFQVSDLDFITNTFLC